MIEQGYQIIKKRIPNRETVRCTVKNYTENSILVYRLIKSVNILTSFGEATPRVGYYSVSIVKLGGDGGREEALLSDVSRDYGEAEYVFDMLARNTVAPENANEIMDDYIGV